VEKQPAAACPDSFLQGFHKRKSNGLTKLSDDTQKHASQTINFYRFRVEPRPRATFELPVIENQALMDSYQLSNITPHDVELFVASNYIDARMRAELEKLIDGLSQIIL
jgi:hypothetical protein